MCYEHSGLHGYLLATPSKLTVLLFYPSALPSISPEPGKYSTWLRPVYGEDNARAIRTPAGLGGEEKKGRKEL